MNDSVTPQRITYETKSFKLTKLMLNLCVTHNKKIKTISKSITFSVVDGFFAASLFSTFAVILASQLSTQQLIVRCETLALLKDSRKSTLENSNIYVQLLLKESILFMFLYSNSRFPTSFAEPPCLFKKFQTLIVQKITCWMFWLDKIWTSSSPESFVIPLERFAFIYMAPGINNKISIVKNQCLTSRTP